MSINYLGIFAFEGEAFFEGSSSLAMKAAAINSLKKTDSEFSKLLNKKEVIKGESLEQTFSKDDDEKLKQLIKKAYKNLYERYHERHPIK
ncbi:MAG: hypothetical protein LBT96_04785 [Campylobacteraceae bacterium]|jgi:hypothetical protein|nr:hypothetical protein [Campylobacteraceae bacterium]